MRLPRLGQRRRIVQLLCLAFILYTTLEPLHIRSRLPPSAQDFAQAVPRRSERLFVTSILWNNEDILRSYWIKVIPALATAIGPENLFFSIYGSGGWDDTKGALKELDEALESLGISRNITMVDSTHDDELSQSKSGPGWIDTPRGKKERRRIPYLSQLRNIALEPLEQLSKRGEKFDKVLFLNDVVFSVDDVLRLLDTNNGDFAAACSLDFSKPPEFYDTFALRDSEGHGYLMPTWPYFRSKESRRAITAHLPVPVRSCWNGMVVMPVKPFISDPPLRFRGIADSLATYHLEGSECCLIHADNPLQSRSRTYLNPNVRVGYNAEAYNAMQSMDQILSSWQIFKALWENRFRRWVTSPRSKQWAVHKKVKSWQKENNQNKEPGEFCLVDEMQVLVGNGWAHV